jgi:5'-3' exoribonuclease 1
MAIERLSDAFTKVKTPDTIRRAGLKNLPRTALLKPAHASSRLQGQHFSLGDRVITVSESGSVPMSAKGTVVGISVGFLDVVFDVQFINGTTLSDR